MVLCILSISRNIPPWLDAQNKTATSAPLEMIVFHSNKKNWFRGEIQIGLSFRKGKDRQVNLPFKGKGPFKCRTRIAYSLGRICEAIAKQTRTLFYLVFSFDFLNHRNFFEFSLSSNLAPPFDDHALFVFSQRFSGISRGTFTASSGDCKVLLIIKTSLVGAADQRRGCAANLVCMYLASKSRPLAASPYWACTIAQRGKEGY